LRWWADDESDEPDVVEIVNQSTECANELSAFDARAVASLEDVGPPGRWICPTCGFSLTRAILRASDGAVGVDTNPLFNICTNDGASLRQVTWKEDAEDANRVGLEQMKRADALNEVLVKALAALNSTLNYWKSTGFDECEPDCDCIVESVRDAIKKAEEVIGEGRR